MARAGRKRKAGVTRTPSGQRSRAKAAQQENLGPIMVRMRMFSLGEVDAKDQKAGTFIGRLNLMKIVSNDQYEAAVKFGSAYERYQRALKSPDALRSSSGGGSGEERDGYEELCRHAVERYEAAMRAVRDEQNIIDNRGANLYAALNYIVTRDEQMWHMVGDCRIALNALAHHFGLIGKRKARRVDVVMAEAQ